MIFIKRTISMALAVLFLFAGIVLAEGEWETNSGGDIYNTNPGGNVGIGTTSPSVKLHVIGPDVTSSTGWKSEIIAGAANNYQSQRVGLGLDASGPRSGIGLMWNGNTLFKVDNIGNVGIGTTSPSRKLHIVSGTAYDYPLLLQAPTTPAIQFLDNTAGTVGYIGGGASGFLTGGGGYGLTIRSEGYGIYFGANRSAATHMAILSSGNVGIGTTDPKSKLAVNGTITAKEIKVESGWSDYVFEETYELPSLNSVESYIKKHKRLPDFPSAKEVKERGLAVSDMLAKQMQKIEEMTLYLFQLKKENDQLKERVAVLEGSIKATLK